MKPGLRAFLAEFGRKPFLIFGFTFMVWQYLLTNVSGRGVDLSQRHPGAQRRMEEARKRWRSATRNSSAASAEATGSREIYNFYGMVEQVGSVYLEGEDGYLYPPNFADVIVRDPSRAGEAAMGSRVSCRWSALLPLSYPGHSLLTEDLGVVHGCDDSKCGRLGKYFFDARPCAASAELRGCSDTHAATRDAA